MGQLQKVLQTHNGNTRGEERAKEREEYLKQQWESPKFIRHQTTDSQSSEDTKRTPDKTIPRHMIWKLQKMNLEAGRWGEAYYQSKDNYIWLLRKHTSKKKVKYLNWWEREKRNTNILYPVKLLLKCKEEILSQTNKIEGVCCQQNFLAINMKSFWERRKIM